MKMEDFLVAVRDELDLSSTGEADRVVRAVVGALKARLPEEQATLIAEALPGELSAGWDRVVPVSDDLADRAEMSLEMEEAGNGKEVAPSYTGYRI